MTRFNGLDGDCLEDCLIVQAVAGLSVGVVLTNNLLGMPGAQCIGQPFHQVLRDPQLAAFWHDAEHHDRNYMGEVSVRWPKPLDLKLNATRCVDRSGVEIGRALLFCDVTDEVAVQVRLSQAVANRLLDLAGGDGTPAAPVTSLTPQEFRILRLVGRGMSNDEIADQASISPSTVRSHLKSAYRKLGLGSRAEAVAYAARNHLV